MGKAMGTFQPFLTSITRSQQIPIVLPLYHICTPYTIQKLYSHLITQQGPGFWLLCISDVVSGLLVKLFFELLLNDLFSLLSVDISIEQ
jgi:hypothetical protein